MVAVGALLSHIDTVPLEGRLTELRHIAQLSEPVLRNLLITQRYHDLSLDLSRVLGSDNANWSTFATWASKTAGQSIREEEVPPEFTKFLQEEAKLEARLKRFYARLGPVSRLMPRLSPFDLARAVIQEVARQIAEGNLRVYAELAPLFAEFSDRFAHQSRESDQELERFLGRLNAGPAAEGGQDDLKRAFRAYYAARASKNPSEKAQLILFGNVLIGLHEQTRLQSNIAGALDAPFSARIYERFGGWGPKFVHPILRWLLRHGLRFFAGKLLDDWQRLATRFLMKLSAPNGEEIPLGSDLPPEAFDPLLHRLTVSELVEFLKQYDADLDTTKGSGAVNWTILSERMRFIGELFRVSQRDVSWFDQPFTDAQRFDIEAGRLPAGKLG